MKDLGIENYSIAIEDISKEKLLEIFKIMATSREKYLDIINKSKVIVMNQRENLIQLIQEKYKKEVK